MGSLITTISGAKVEILSKLGEGGQGVVYKINYNGQPKALKMYKPGVIKDPDAFYDNLCNNINAKAPSKEFLWPLDALPKKETAKGPVFGYVMDLRPPEYYDLSLFLAGQVRFASYRTVADAALQIISAFRVLHSRGYSYQDLNDGNFFINPDTGAVLICDNDNVAPNMKQTGILGKPRYMAPEIVRGEAMPSTNTDRFSLSVILFLMLCMAHPLEGVKYLVPCLTAEIEQKLYGTNPVFILDPEDKSNRPVRGIHDNIGLVWPELPSYLREAFTRAFSKTVLFDPERRITEQEWQELFIRFRSGIIKCPMCDDENLNWDPDNRACTCCHTPFDKFATMKMGGCDYLVPVIRGNVVFRGQTGPTDLHTYGKPMVKIVINPKDSSLYVQNICGEKLECITPSGKHVMIEHGQPVPAKPGILLRSGGTHTISIQP